MNIVRRALLLVTIMAFALSSVSPALAFGGKYRRFTRNTILQQVLKINAETGEFSTLIAAVTAAKLERALDGRQPFTVFAPTDEAFAKLGLNAENIAATFDARSLRKILLYHLTYGQRSAKSLLNVNSIRMLDFRKAFITVNEQGAFINNAKIIQTDIYARNGIIHVVDSVILPPRDIVDTAMKDARFTTLVAALQAAGLVDALKGEGPFTVFAPTNDAFAKLPAGTIEELLKPENLETLQKILLYHVAPGFNFAAQIAQMSELMTAAGLPVMIKVQDGKVFINESQVIITNILTSNGVIHVIDSVLLPPAPAPKDIVDIAVADGRFTTLVAALQAAGLVDALKGEGPFTVFAPTDDAFAKLPAGTVEELLKPENLETLQKILLYHVVAGKVMAADVVNLTSATTLAGLDVHIRVEGGKVFINDAEVIITDIEASNGVIHVIDSVLLP